MAQGLRCSQGVQKSPRTLSLAQPKQVWTGARAAGFACRVCKDPLPELGRQKDKRGCSIPKQHLSIWYHTSALHHTSAHLEFQNVQWERTCHNQRSRRRRSREKEWEGKREPGEGCEEECGRVSFTQPSYWKSPKCYVFLTTENTGGWDIVPPIKQVTILIRSRLSLSNKCFICRYAHSPNQIFSANVSRADSVEGKR